MILAPTPVAEAGRGMVPHANHETKMRRSQILLVAVAALALSDTAASANVVTLTPTSQDYIAHLGNGNLIGPFGPNASFGVLLGTLNGRLNAGDPTSSNEARAVAEFDLTSLLPATINSASFSFIVRDPSLFGTTCFDLIGCPPVTGLDIASFSGTGAVVVGNFNSGASFALLAPPPAYGATEMLDVTSEVSSVISGGGDFPSFRLTAMPGLDGAVGITDLTLRVDFTPGGGGGTVPEPASFMLLGLGLAGLGFMRRRRAA